MAVSACIALLPSLLADSASGFIVRLLMAASACIALLPCLLAGFCLWVALLVINGGFCLIYSIAAERRILPLGSLLVINGGFYAAV
jgi:hypothetical protein